MAETSTLMTIDRVSWRNMPVFVAADSHRADCWKATVSMPARAAGDMVGAGFSTAGVYR
jgi:hypothetical protein